MKLYKTPNAGDDWSYVGWVWVIYPDISGGGTDEYKLFGERSKMVYHGRLAANENSCIVESEDGQIHVVSVNTVWHDRL